MIIMVLLPISINIRVIYLFEIHFKICRVQGNKRSVLTSGMMFALREFSILLEFSCLAGIRKIRFFKDAIINRGGNLASKKSGKTVLSTSASKMLRNSS